MEDSLGMAAAGAARLLIPGTLAVTPGVLTPSVVRQSKKKTVPL